MTAEAVQDYFTNLSARAEAATLQGVHKTCAFDIQGAGRWLVRVDDGAVTVISGEGEADCRVTMSAEVFERILRGEQKPTSAYLTGNMKIRGELAALMRMQVLLSAQG
jgi:putative sterol carrier protein